MPYKDRATKLAYGKQYHKANYVRKERKVRTDKEYVVCSDGIRRSKESLANKKAYLSKWHQENRERRLVDQKKHYLNNKDASKNKWLKKDFGITLEDYNQLLASQEGVCAICLRPETQKTIKGGPKALAVDHCHQSGKIRGLLCAACNQAIGLLGDDPLRAETLARYLRERG